MAITITHLTDATSTSTTTSLTTSNSITAAVGDWLVVVLCMTFPHDSTLSYFSSLGDSDGINTYTTRAQVGYAPSAGTNSGAEILIATCAVTDALTSASITANFSPGVFNKTLTVYRLQGSGLSFVAADTTGSTGNATNHSAATVSVSNGNIIFGAAAIETNDAITGDSDTTNGSWSTTVAALGDSGIDGTSMTGVSQYKTVTATGNQSWACSTTSARNSARTYVVIHGSAAAFTLSAALGQYSLAGTAVTMRLGNAPIVAGPGSYTMTGTTPVSPKLGRTVTALAGSYTYTGTDANTLHAWKVTVDVGSYALSGTDAIPFKTAVAGQTLPAASGSYALTGTDASALHIGANIVAEAGSYALTGTNATLTHGYRIAAGDESVGVVLGDLLLETGDFLLFESGDFLLLEEASTTITGGVYSLTGNTVNLNATAGNKTSSVDSGSYVLTGTTAPVLHAWRIAAGDIELVPLLDELGDPMLDELGNPLYAETGEITGGAYSLTGTDVTLTTSVVSHFTIAVESGSYLLTGTEVTLRSSAQPAVSPLHIGEWPIDKRRRRRREDAAAAEQRARKRFRDAIGRLLEGLPPEFDEPADLDEALDNAVQASNLLYALSAPIREINAVNELIDHIRQLRIAQPIAQSHLAQAYNQAHRHLMAKAQEDTVMALLLGE